MNNSYTINFRDYTTDGRFLDKKLVLTTGCSLREDLSDLLSEDALWGVKDFYVREGVMKDGEEVKRVWRTNIMVRDSKTNKLVKWKDLL